MSSAKAPKTPDYTSAAIAQGQSDKEIAQYLTQANRVNQVDPYGQTTWTQSMTPEQQQAKTDATNALAQYTAAAASKGWDRWQPAEVAKQKALLQAKIDQQGNNWTQTTTLTPEQQKLLNQQQFIGSMQNDRIANLIATTGDPTAPTLGAQRQLAQYDLAPERQLQQRTLDIAQMAPQRTLDIAQMGPQRTLKEADQNNIQDLLYGQITKQYGDRFAKEEAAQRAQLANQGFQAGSEGFNTSLNDFTREKNSAYQDAATQAALSSYDQLNKERGLNQSEYGLLSADDLNRFNSQQGANLGNYNALSADDLNRFQAQTTANLGNYGALTANDLDQFTALSNNDLSRYGALNANALNQFSALSSDDLNRYNSQLGQYNTDKGFLAQLLGGVAGPTNPQYQPYAQATPYQAPDLLGAMQGQYQGNLNKTNAKNASNSQNMQTAGTIASAAAVAF